MLTTLRFLLLEFGPLLLFYAVKVGRDLKSAILVGMVYSFIYMAYRWFKKWEISPFLIFSTGLILLFGVMDLYSEDVFFFKFEAAMTNLFFAVFFGLSLTKKRTPIILDFAQRQGQVSQERIDKDLLYFFKLLTLIWVIYYVVKAVTYIWIGYHFDFDQGLYYRTVYGNLTFYFLLGFSLLGGKIFYRFLFRLKLLPSQVEKGSYEKQNSL